MLVSGSESLKKNIDVVKNSFSNYLSLDENNLITAASGLGFIRGRTVFGFAAFGVNHYSNHAFIVLRGTEFGGDALTDMNVGVSHSSTYKYVHDGFNETFQSLKHDLDKFIIELRQKNIAHVHCIGHSLDGAVASLVAEYVQVSTSLRPYIYTFGAPRVGFGSFANHLTQEVTPQRIFRFYHRTDIVPCVPFWPFVHAPSFMADTCDYFLPSPGVVPSGAWHRMTTYADSVSRKSWGQLRSLRDEPITDRKIESWLKRKSPIHFTLTNLRWLDRAIAYVVNKCVTAAGMGLTMAFSSGFTIMDRLAYILRKGIDLSANLTSLVMRLIRKILSLLGLRPVVDKSEASQQFVSGLFARLADRVNGQVKSALNQAFYGGQAL